MTTNHQLNVHRPIYETPQESYDIFFWQVSQKVTKSLTLQYDKVMYLLEKTLEDESIVSKNIMVMITLMVKYNPVNNSV